MKMRAFMSEMGDFVREFMINSAGKCPYFAKN